MEPRNRNIWIFVAVALVMLCCCLAAVAAAAAVSFTRWSGDLDWEGGRLAERSVQTYEVGRSPTLAVDSFAGDVSIQAGRDGSITVVITKKARSAPNVERIEIDWERRGDEIKIKTSRPRSFVGDASVDIEIIAPVSTQLEVHTGAGDVSTVGIVGEIDAGTGAGDIHVSAGSGPVRLDTGAGGIDYEGEPLGNCRFETGAGDIILRLPADVNVEVDLDTGIGEVDTDGFDVHGTVSRGEVKGTIGTGSQGEIKAQTGAGDIELRRR
jgi:hypothetical protein